jgi:hypothetical protein
VRIVVLLAYVALDEADPGGEPGPLPQPAISIPIASEPFKNTRKRITPLWP